MEVKCPYGSYWMCRSQLNVGGLVLDGYARLRRSHFLIKNLLTCNRAGAHCVIATHDACAEYSVWHSTLIYKLKYGKVKSRETEKGQKMNQDTISPIAQMIVD